ncbi:unnamed protein product [Penicillium palitans]
MNMLLTNPDIDVNRKDMDINTPLWWSTGLGHDDISFRPLAEAGVELNAVGWKSGLSIYHASFSCHGKTEIFACGTTCRKPRVRPQRSRVFSLDTPRPRCTRRQYRYGEATTSERRSSMVVDLLLQQGNQVDINCRNNKDGKTALSAAAGSGDRDLHLVKLTLEDSRTDPNAVDKSGKTAIWHADSKGHLQVANELLKDPRLHCDLKSIASVVGNH